MAYRHEPLDPDDPLLGFKPVPHKAARRNSIVPARQRAFIASLAECGIVTHAARHIGSSVEALYRLRNWPGGEEFRAAWDEALDRSIGRLEDIALTRAIEGEERMVVSAGKLMGYETRYNDALIMFFLRNRRGERYAPDWRALKPGHPVYEKIKAEAIEAYEAADEENEQATLESLDAFFEGLRQKRLANEALEAEFEAEEAEKERARAEETARRKRVEGDEGEDRYSGATALSTSAFSAVLAAASTARAGSARRMLSSRNCLEATTEGAPIIRSCARWFIGKAMTSRMLGSSASSMTMRSMPGAEPPCGGAPSLNASIMPEKLASTSARL
jgi:hypothetical protein